MAVTTTLETGAMKTMRCNHCCDSGHSQDLIYGQGKRAFIFTNKAFGRKGGWRCTACGGDKEA